MFDKRVFDHLATLVLLEAESFERIPQRESLGIDRADGAKITECILPIDVDESHFVRLNVEAFAELDEFQIVPLGIQ